MKQNSSKTKKFLRSLILVLGFIVFLVITFTISWKFFEKQAEEYLSNSTTEYFPVVVISSDKAEIVFTKDLEKYKQDNPNYSFLIPKEKADLINKQIKEDQIRRNRKGIPQISAETIAEGKQLIEFEILTDGLLLSRYEATEKEVKPLMFKSAGPGFVFFPCAATLFFGFTGFFLLRFFLWLIKNRQRNSENI